MTGISNIGIGVKQGSALGTSLDKWVAFRFPWPEDVRFAANLSRSMQRQRTRKYSTEAEDQARLVMRVRHHVSFGAKDDFAISGNQTFLDLWASISRAFFAVTIGIASIHWWSAESW